jgi:hypothetical protein
MFFFISGKEADTECGIRTLSVPFGGIIWFKLCERDSSYLVGSQSKKRQNVWNYIIPFRSWGTSSGIRPFFSRMPVWEYVGE